MILAVGNDITIPEDFAIKLATIETNIKLNLALLGAQGVIKSETPAY